MTIENKLMLQRRGNSSDLPNLREGQIAITLDKNELYFGSSGGNVKAVTSSEIVDSLSSNESNKVLSAKQGSVLNGKVDNLNSYVQGYMNNVNSELDTKQDILLIKSDTAPVATDVIWYNTGI